MPSATDSPYEVRMSRVVKRLLWFVVVLSVLIVALVLWTHRFGTPEEFPDIQNHFKYGSTGSDNPLTRGVPYWVWKVLPDMFPPETTLPRGFEARNGKTGYAAFGLVYEDKDRPIGFSKRRVFGFDFIGFNCAFCHVSTLSVDGKQKIILGGPGNNIDIEQYFLFLFAATGSPRFNSDELMTVIVAQNPQMSWFERVTYRFVMIPLVRYYVGRLKDKFDFIDPEKHRLPRFGPGRVDTWAAYKRVFLEPPDRELVPGIADFPALWNQQAREGMRLHWDGNTPLLDERNIISALGAIGPSIEYLDYPQLQRVTQWITYLPPPRYADWMKIRINAPLAQRGAEIFGWNCAQCHALGGSRTGKVEPIEYLGTDGNRVRDFTPALAAALNRIGTDAWRLRYFEASNGYSNMLLDGIWLRAPYLHNGSVPTLRDLLNKPELRPAEFCRGSEEYNRQDLGFEWKLLAQGTPEPCRNLFFYDTRIPGNDNGGHVYGTDLSPFEKNALLEYLKTL
jgi:hypothetical protein